jgi:hypothetical protein
MKFGDTMRCICGGTIRSYEFDPGDMAWVHLCKGFTPCTEAAPADEQVPDHDDEIAEAGRKFKAAQVEVERAREEMAQVGDRLDRLNRNLLTANTVRRATLVQVWDRLIDAGHVAAAQIVTRMIESRDWS